MISANKNTWNINNIIDIHVLHQQMCMRNSLVFIQTICKLITAWSVAYHSRSLSLSLSSIFNIVYINLVLVLSTYMLRKSPTFAPCLLYVLYAFKMSLQSFHDHGVSACFCYCCCCIYLFAFCSNNCTFWAWYWFNSANIFHPRLSLHLGHQKMFATKHNRFLLFAQFIYYTFNVQTKNFCIHIDGPRAPSALLNYKLNPLLSRILCVYQSLKSVNFATQKLYLFSAWLLFLSRFFILEIVEFGLWRLCGILCWNSFIFNYCPKFQCFTQNLQIFHELKMFCYRHYSMYI